MSNTGAVNRDVVAGPGPELTSRLGYLLKHVRIRFAEMTAAALAPYGLDGRELAVLLVLGASEPFSQRDAAHRLGVDRSTMVALLDALESKGLLSRHPRPEDRRKNVVALTKVGRDTLRDATKANDEAEHRFLSALTPPAARQLKMALQTLVTEADLNDAALRTNVR